VTKLNPAGSAILWSTFVGDAKSDGSDALFFTGPIQLDGRGNVYIMGQAAGGFPLVNPVETAGNGGDMQVLVAELDPRARTCCSPHLSVRAGSAPRVRPGWQSIPPATSISPAITSARA